MITALIFFTATMSGLLEDSPIGIRGSRNDEVVMPVYAIPALCDRKHCWDIWLIVSTTLQQPTRHKRSLMGLPRLNDMNKIATYQQSSRYADPPVSRGMFPSIQQRFSVHGLTQSLFPVTDDIVLPPNRDRLESQASVRLVWVLGKLGVDRTTQRAESPH